METLIKFFFLFLVTVNSYAVCNAPISRTNIGANQTLTSSEYNTSLNTVYTHSNDLDGSCLTDASVSAAKLDSSTLQPLLKSAHRGCRVVFSGVNTINVEKCLLAVNGKFVETTINTSVTWGCSGCATEASSTQYYVYAKDGSDGSTLTLQILTTIPGTDGYDGSNNLCLGRFYNNAGSDIDTYSIDQFITNEFKTQTMDWVNIVQDIQGKTSDPTKPNTVDTDTMRWKRVGQYMFIEYAYFASSGTGGLNGSGPYFVATPTPYLFKAYLETDNSVSNVLYGANLGSCSFGSGSSQSPGFAHAYSNIEFGMSSAAGSKIDSASFNLSLNGVFYRCKLRIPIEGWKEGSVF